MKRTQGLVRPTIDMAKMLLSRRLVSSSLRGGAFLLLDACRFYALRVSRSRMAARLRRNSTLTLRRLAEQ